MKRSEILKLIEQVIHADKDNSDVQTKAENMLNSLEQAGMMPPCLPENHCQAIMQIYYGGYSFYKWEEDFQKDPKVVEALERILNRKSNKSKVRAK